MNISVEMMVPSALQELKDGVGVIANWHLHAAELADLEQETVRGRTPVLTGALKDSTAALANVSQSELVHVYYDDTLQLSTWHRIYAEYQEGPPLGTPTYTNGPREMLGRADPDDLPQIREWAEKYARSWGEDLVTAAGGEM